MLKRLHVNQHNIRANTKAGNGRLPVISAKTYKDNVYGHYAMILDESGNVVAKLIYRPHSPLPCGAKVWIETDNDVHIVDESEQMLKVL